MSKQGYKMMLVVALLAATHCVVAGNVAGFMRFKSANMPALKCNEGEIMLTKYCAKFYNTRVTKGQAEQACTSEEKVLWPTDLSVGDLQTLLNENKDKKSVWTMGKLNEKCKIYNFRAQDYRANECHKKRAYYCFTVVKREETSDEDRPDEQPDQQVDQQQDKQVDQQQDKQVDQQSDEQTEQQTEQQQDEQTTPTTSVTVNFDEEDCIEFNKVKYCFAFVNNVKMSWRNARKVCLNNKAFLAEPMLPPILIGMVDIVREKTSVGESFWTGAIKKQNSHEITMDHSGDVWNRKHSIDYHVEYCLSIRLTTETSKGYSQEFDKDCDNLELPFLCEKIIEDTTESQSTDSSDPTPAPSVLLSTEEDETNSQNTDSSEPTPSVLPTTAEVKSNSQTTDSSEPTPSVLPTTEVNNFNPDRCADYSGEIYCFEVVDVKMSWSSAREACSKKNAFLVEPKEVVMRDDVRNAVDLKTGEDTIFWIGASKKQNSSEWIWNQNGDIVKVVADDNVHDQELCLGLKTETVSGYTDLVQKRCDMDLPFVCQTISEPTTSTPTPVASKYSQQCKKEVFNRVEGIINKRRNETECQKALQPFWTSSYIVYYYTFGLASVDEYTLDIACEVQEMAKLNKSFINETCQFEQPCESDPSPDPVKYMIDEFLVAEAGKQIMDYACSPGARALMGSFGSSPCFGYPATVKAIEEQCNASLLWRQGTTCYDENIITDCIVEASAKICGWDFSVFVDDIYRLLNPAFEKFAKRKECAPMNSCGDDTEDDFDGNTVIDPNDNSVVDTYDNLVVDPNDNLVVGPNDNSVVGPNDNSVVGPNDNAVVDPNNNAVVDPNDNAVVDPNDNSVGDSNDNMEDKTNGLMKGNTNGEVQSDTHVVMQGGSKEMVQESGQDIQTLAKQFEELRTKSRAADCVDLFMDIDGNKNNMLDWQEACNGEYCDHYEFFKSADENNNGKLELGELCPWSRVTA